MRLPEPPRRRGGAGAFLAGLAVALLLSSGAGADEAQELAGTTPEQRATAQTDYMRDKLALSPDVASRVQQVNLDAAKKMEPVLKGDLGPLKKLAQGQQVQRDRESALQGILTPEQFQKYLDMKPEMRAAVEAKLAATGAR